MGCEHAVDLMLALMEQATFNTLVVEAGKGDALSDVVRTIRQATEDFQSQRAELTESCQRVAREQGVEECDAFLSTFRGFLESFAEGGGLNESWARVGLSRIGDGHFAWFPERCRREQGVL